MAGAGEPRLHGANGDAEREGDLLVAEAVDFAQDNGRPLVERQVIQRMLKPLRQFFLGEQTVRCRFPTRPEFAMGGNVLIERHLIGAVTPPPESVPVACLVHRDPVNPGAKARLAAESVNGAEHAEEDFLRKIQRLVVIAEQVHRQLDDHSLVLADQLGTGRFLAYGTPLDKRRLAAPDVAPTGNARLFHGELHYIKLDPGRG